MNDPDKDAVARFVEKVGAGNARRGLIQIWLNSSGREWRAIDLTIAGKFYSVSWAGGTATHSEIAAALRAA